MISILLTVGVVAVVGMIGLSVESPTYGSRLEEYIISKNPQDTADVERLTKEYDLAAGKRFL